MPCVDGVLCEIGKWKYFVITNLLKSFYQISLANSSMKYCGVATSFNGIHAYTCSAMRMPESETFLEERMSRVLGDLIQEGCAAKIVDDLFVGGNSPIEVLDNWKRVFDPLQRTIFAYPQPKLSYAQERPSHWAGCGLTAPCKLAPKIGSTILGQASLYSARPPLLCRSLQGSKPCASKICKAASSPGPSHCTKGIQRKNCVVR